MFEKIKDRIKVTLIHIVFMAISSFAISGIWNFLMPNMFGLKEVSTIQIFLLLFLVSFILFSVLYSIFLYFTDIIKTEGTIEIIITKDEEKES